MGPFFAEFGSRYILAELTKYRISVIDLLFGKENIDTDEA
jgi:hypothetical protein